MSILVGPTGEISLPQYNNTRLSRVFITRSYTELTNFSTIGTIWPDCPLIDRLECEFAVSSDETREQARWSLLSALVNSVEPDDVRCGIAILQDSLLHARTPKQKRKVMYLLVAGYYRLGNYSKCIDLLAACLEIKPRCVSVISLRMRVTNRVNEARGYKILIISAKTVGLVTGLLGSTTIFLHPTLVVEALTYKCLTEDCVKKVVTALPDTSNPLQVEEEVYLLAHRYYIRANFEDLSRGSYLIDRCLEISPEWKPAIIKSASVKAYIGETISVGIYFIAGVFGTIAVLMWSFD